MQRKQHDDSDYCCEDVAPDRDHVKRSTQRIRPQRDADDCTANNEGGWPGLEPMFGTRLASRSRWPKLPPKPAPQTGAHWGATVRFGAVCPYSKPGSAWWRRRELNPRPKQSPTGSLRACPGFWFSLCGSSRRDPLLPAAVGVPHRGRGALDAAIRSVLMPFPSPPD